MWPRIAKSVSEFTPQKADQKATCFRLTTQCLTLSLSLSLFSLLHMFVFIFVLFPPFHTGPFSFHVETAFKDDSKAFLCQFAKFHFLFLCNAERCFFFFLSHAVRQKTHFHCRSLWNELSVLWLHHKATGSSLKLPKGFAINAYSLRIWR